MLMGVSSSAPVVRRLLGRAHCRRVSLGAVLFLIYGSILPFNYTPLTWNEAYTSFTNRTLYDFTPLEARGDWIGSVVLYAIVSFFLMASLCVDRRWRRGILAALAVISFVLLLSII